MVQPAVLRASSLQYPPHASSISSSVSLTELPACLPAVDLFHLFFHGLLPIPLLTIHPPQCVQQISMLWPATSSWVAMGKSAKEEIRGLHRMAGQRDGEG